VRLPLSLVTAHELASINTRAPSWADCYPSNPGVAKQSMTITPTVFWRRPFRGPLAVVDFLCRNSVSDKATSYMMRQDLLRFAVLPLELTSWLMLEAVVVVVVVAAAAAAKYK
jgi:hypothetical protein